MAETVHFVASFLRNFTLPFEFSGKADSEGQVGGGIRQHLRGMVLHFGADWFFLDCARDTTWTFLATALTTSPGGMEGLKNQLKAQKNHLNLTGFQIIDELG